MTSIETNNALLEHATGRACQVGHLPTELRYRLCLSSFDACIPSRWTWCRQILPLILYKKCQTSCLAVNIPPFQSSPTLTTTPDVQQAKAQGRSPIISITHNCLHMNIARQNLESQTITNACTANRLRHGNDIVSEKLERAPRPHLFHTVRLPIFFIITHR